jgi:hypothetical protein
MNQVAPDKAGISIIRISNEKEMRAWDVDTLARELWGNEVPRQYPVYVVHYQGRPCGFFLSIHQLVVYPAMHPERMSPRAFLKVVKSLVTEFKRMAGNPIFMLCNKTEQFGERNLKRIHLKRATANAFVYDEEAK